MDNPQMDYDTLTGAKSQGCIDAENLDLLALFHYILGAVIALFSSFFIFHIVMGLRLIQHPNAFPFAVTPSVPVPAMPNPTFPPEAGYMFAIMGTLAVVGGWTLGVLTAFAGRCLKARKNYVFIQVIAGLVCVFVTPLGTVLGVFTFVVLARPSVKPLFERQSEKNNITRTS